MDLDDLLDDLQEAAETNMDCEHDVSQEEDGVHHCITYYLEERGREKMKQSITRFLEK